MHSLGQCVRNTVTATFLLHLTARTHAHTKHIPASHASDLQQIAYAILRLLMHDRPPVFITVHAFVTVKVQHKQYQNR